MIVAGAGNNCSQDGSQMLRNRAVIVDGIHGLQL